MPDTFPMYDPPKKSRENKAPRGTPNETYYRDHRGLYVLVDGVPLTIKQVRDLGSDFGKRLRELRQGQFETDLSQKITKQFEKGSS